MYIKICLPARIGKISVSFLSQKRVEDVISPIVFEAAYSLGEHVIERGKEDKELPALKPILRWKKGQKIAQRNQVRFGLCYFRRSPVTDSRTGRKRGLPGSGSFAYSSPFVQSLLLLTSALLHDIVNSCADKVGQRKVRSLFCFRVFVLGRRRLNKGKVEKGPTPFGSSISVEASCERLGPDLLSRLSL